MPDTETESVNAKAGKSKKEAKPFPEPPFLIDYAPTARGKCKECLTSIEKDVLRFAIAKSFRGHWHYELRHWGCATPEQIKAINDHESKSDVKVLGMEKLKTEDQDRAKKALKRGHVDEKDAEAQKEKSEVAREKEGEQKKEKAKGKAEQKRKAADEDTHNEPKAKKKKTKDTEEPESPKKKSKAKEHKEKEAEQEHKEEKIAKRVAPPASQIEDETVPDSEEEREVTIKKYKSDEKSPKKDKSKKSSKKKDDSAMDIDWPLTPPRSDKDPNNKRKEAKDKKQKSPKKKAVNEEEEDEDINEVNDLIRTSSLDKLPDKKTKAAEVESEDEEALATKAKATGKNASSVKDESKAKAASTSKKDSVEAPSKATKGKAEPAEKKPRAPRKSTSMKKPEPSTSASMPPTPAHNSTTPVYVDITKIAPLLHSSHPRPSAKLPPKLPLSVFCKRYDLSNSLQQKLKGMEIDGPHVLRLIRDDALEKQGLSVGELAGLRDAEERWMADNS